MVRAMEVPLPPPLLLTSRPSPSPRLPSFFSFSAPALPTAQVTIRKLIVFKVDVENKCLIIKGAVPGKTGNFLKVRRRP